MPARVIESLATTDSLSDLFSDQSVLQAMLDFESALARAEARLGVIPKSAADVITGAAKAEAFDTASLARDTLRAGTFGTPLAKALTDRVRAINPEAAGFVQPARTFLTLHSFYSLSAHSRFWRMTCHVWNAPLRNYRRFTETR